MCGSVISKLKRVDQASSVPRENGCKCIRESLQLLSSLFERLSRAQWRAIYTDVDAEQLYKQEDILEK
jgi:hypothetical protein